MTIADRPPESVEGHPFVRRPHRTLVTLTLPVLVSLLAEPVTGLVDTAFIARLGAAPLAAVGVATALLSSVFWVFNFLGIGTQTEVAQALGDGRPAHAREANGLALALGALLGCALGALGWTLAEPATAFMTPDAAVRTPAVSYLEIRLLGSPAVLLTMAAFGSLRGLQDMRTPLWIALGTNALNVVLDAVLIFGLGPIPAFGISGAAWASTASQWLGAAWVFAAVRRRPGLPANLHWAEAGALLVVGRDLFLRTGLLLVFMLLSTRVANRIGVEAGAAHQAIRQIWILTAFILDAYAAAAQSLVAYFVGAARRDLARRVAGVACVWGVATGVALSAVLLAGRSAVEALLVPDSASAIFATAWGISALAQPANAISFVTDGIHWGTRDYRYLRNAMFAATAGGAALLFTLDEASADALERVWLVTAGWIGIRGFFGLVRVWPGLGASPLAAKR